MVEFFHDLNLINKTLFSLLLGEKVLLGEGLDCEPLLGVLVLH